MFSQLSLFPEVEVEIPPPEWIDRYIVACSFGKDSVNLLIWAIENLPRDKIEVWHHLIDGTNNNFMDWEVTRSYGEAICKYLNLPLYFSWLEDGFKGELLRDNAPKKPVWFETPDGLKSAGGKGQDNTRKRFPAKSSNHSQRWCSSYLKSDVAKIAINNQERFKHAKIVILTGERREESASRNKYKKSQYYMQPTKNRTVYQYRVILDYTEQEVWDTIARYKIRVHPAYQLGFNRVSCRSCIFSDCNQWATIQRDYAHQFETISQLERDLNHTIDNKLSVEQMANRGQPYPLNPELIAIATSTSYDLPIYDPNWQIPAGAFRGYKGGAP
jgi:3'-phosphoadenosine 5'-phosphosulfate sulfotransferase (PAPS reductase)/FAD synthetase